MMAVAHATGSGMLTVVESVMRQLRASTGRKAVSENVSAAAMSHREPDMAANGRHQMIGKPPRWIPIVVWALSIIWIIPLLGIVVTSVRPEGDTVLGWWRLDHVQFTLDAWVRVSLVGIAGLEDTGDVEQED